MRYATQSFGLDRSIADLEHSTGVTVETILDNRNVHIDDIALSENAVTRHAMTHLVIDRGADRLWEWLVARRGIIQRRRYDFLNVHHEIVAKSIEFPGGYPWLNLWGYVIQHVRRKPASDAHSFDIFVILDAYCHTDSEQMVGTS